MTSPPLLLSEHHQALTSFGVALRTSAFADDPAAVVARFRDLERAVLLHMRAEEEELLPDYAAYDPADAALIRATHEELRLQLYRLGVESELHCIRLETIDTLLATLREHAAHEDTTLYPWAARNLGLGRRRALFQSISTSLRRLAGAYPASPIARVYP